MYFSGKVYYFLHIKWQKQTSYINYYINIVDFGTQYTECCHSDVAFWENFPSSIVNFY